MASSNTPKRPPALSVVGRENELITKAYRMAEQQIDEGTASSQVLTHFLKLGTETEQLARERLRNENLLIAARVKQIEDADVMETLYKKAIRAMSTYQGAEVDDDDE